MALQFENNILTFENNNKWSPVQGLVFGAIAGVFLGIVNDALEAGVVVFCIVSFFGIVLTLYERLTSYQRITIDFESKTLKAQNTFLKWSIKSITIADFDIDAFGFVDYDARKKFFHKYWFIYKDGFKVETLTLLFSKELMQEVIEVFKKYGAEPSFKAERIGKFLIKK